MEYIDVLILRAHGPHSNVPFEETIKGMKVRMARRMACGSRACACPGACVMLWCKLGCLSSEMRTGASRKT